MSDENKVMRIKDNAVVGTELYNTAKRLVVPKGIVEIGANAFNNCERHLIEVVLPDSLKTIGDGAFSHCRVLKRLDIPAGVNMIGAWAFCSTAVPRLVIPDGITRIEEYTFCNVYSKTVVLPDTVEFIGRAAFIDASIQSIYIPKSVKVIERDAFKNCRNLTIYCEGEPAEGWISTVVTVVEREYITTAEDDAFNFHRSGGGFTSHAVETEKQEAADWNVDNRPVYTNVSRADYENKLIDAAAKRILEKYRAAFEELAK